MNKSEKLVKDAIEMTTQAGIYFLNSLGLLMEVLYDNVSSITIRMDKNGENEESEVVSEETDAQESYEDTAPEEKEVGEETVREAEKATESDESQAVKQYTKEEVRVILTGIAKAGHKQEVKDLLAKYNATNLGKVDPKDYAALVADAEVLTNG